MPLLILEGPDGSGKSTLAAKLLKGTGHPTLLVKRSGPPGSVETLEFQSRWIKEQSEQGLNVIADRHPLISEAIYRPTVRLQGQTPWNVHDVATALDQLDRNKILLIYCRPPDAKLKLSSKVENQMDGVHERYQALVNEYDRWYRVFREYSLPIVKYDFEYDPEGGLAIAHVKHFWELP